MTAPPELVQAVQSGIVASAHLAAYEHVAAAAQACLRLGGLTSGRCRAAARDLDRLEEDLQRTFASAAEALTQRAQAVGVHEEALWTAGDAAGTLDLLREAALDEVEADSRAAQVLRGEILFGVSFVEDEELADRGTTLLFGWPEPLAPATWPWQASWIVGDQQSDAEEQAETLDLYEAGEFEVDEQFVAALAGELGGAPNKDVVQALRDAALALTRASLS